MTSPLRTRPARPSLRAPLQKLHLWASLFVGLFLVVVTTTGVAALFQVEINRAFYPGLHQVTPGPRVGLDAARARLAAQRPDLTIHDGVTRKHAPYLFYVTPRGTDEPYMVAYVDAGSGHLNGVIDQGHTVIGVLTRVHYSLLADGVKFTYPRWVPAWIQTWVGGTLSEPLLKVTALALFVMVVTGAVIWWPRRSQWRQAFALRRHKSQYLRDLDWHRLLGFLSLPFLLMWAVTALNFYEPFQTPIKRAWYALTLAGPVAADRDVKSKVMKGMPYVTAGQAERIAAQAVPGSTFVSYARPDTPDGVVSVWLTPKGADPYAYSEFPGQVQLKLDAYSGRVLDDGLGNQRTWGARVYNAWFYANHAGTYLPWPLRLLWAFFGLTPLFLAVTGTRMWWVKRQARLGQERKRQARAASRPAAVPPTPVPPVISPPLGAFGPNDPPLS